MICLRAQVAASLLALAWTIPSHADAADPWIPLGDVRAGQRAEVRTVFEGARIDTFAAEIVGVLRGGRVGGDVILARATGEPALRTGVAQGMSGSPVYVDGKLIGALSSGWSFTREPIFGITPIQEMLEVLALPPGATGGSTAGPSGVEAASPQARIPESSAWGPFRWEADPTADAAAAGGRPAGEPVDAGASALRPLSVPLACVGIDPRALDLLRARFESLGFSAAPAGRAPGGGPRADALVPGSAVSVDLLRGDLELSAIGTLTYRDGDRVLAFGHPFFNAGRVSLPLSSAEIAMVVPSSLSSFKVGMPGRTVGTLLEDRRSAIAGRVGPVPRLLPITVDVRGARPEAQRFHFECVEDRTLAPQLIAVAALNAALESGGTGVNQTARWQLRVRAPGRAPLELADRVAGDGFMSDLLGQLVSPLAFLFNNPYQTLRLDSVEITIELEPGRDQRTLRSARLDRPSVKPGGEVVVRLELERYRGGSETREIHVPVPAEIGEGNAIVWVGGGPELSRFEAQRLPGRYRVGSLDEAWRRMASVRTSDGVYAAVVVPAIEISAGGQDFPELPASAQAVLASPVLRGDPARSGRVALLSERRMAVDSVVRGEIQLPLRVDNDAP